VALPHVGIILRLTHTGKAGDSVLIDDLGDGTDPDSFRKVGAVYVPRGDQPANPGHVDLTYSTDVSISYRQGAVRKFIENGYLTAEFFFGPLAQQAAVGQVTVTTTPYDARPGDREIHVCTIGTPVTVQLPPIPTHQTGHVFVLDARGTAAVNPITVLPAPGETINGGASAVINTNHGFLDLFSDCISDWTNVSTGGGGVTAHNLLQAPTLVWTASAHTGNANTLAGFDGAGAAAYYPIPTGSAQLLWGNDVVGGTTTTRYLTPGYDESLAQTMAVQIRAVRAGTLRNLRVRHNVPAGNGNNIVYTLRVNGAATALSATLASTATDSADLVNAVVVAAGDLLDFEVTKPALVGASPNDVVATVEFV